MNSNSRTPKSLPVDDWEDEEDEDDSEQPPSIQQNQKIWETANAKAPAPMPAVIISSSSTTFSVVSPLPGAFQPKMQILKRPQNTATTSNNSSLSTSTDSLKDREARYQAARDRIFGQEDNSQHRTVSSDFAAAGCAHFAVQLLRRRIRSTLWP
ncbi:hypothetical protein C8J56DRAFT_926611 [Mycena floridula]|nr:hypothetical protein C8J56DRAFT_926611 [Mycena floridula]